VYRAHGFDRRARGIEGRVIAAFELGLDLELLEVMPDQAHAIQRQLD
jgi:hypothetical protein